MSTNFVNVSHGVIYTPSTLEKSAIPTLQQLKVIGIKYIRVQWVDLTNNIRLRVVPLSFFEKQMASVRPGFAIPKSLMARVYLMLPEDLNVPEEYLYVPNLSTLRICSYAPGHASILGWLEEKAPYNGPDGELTVKSTMCPRTKLQRIVQQAKDEMNVEWLVGFEPEFILLKSTNPIEVVNYHHSSHSGGLLSGSVEAKVMDEIADALISSGIEVQLFHAEAAPGQYEVVTGPSSPLEAADALIHTRETITNIAACHGLRATFAPRIHMQSAGSGMHAHISVHVPGEDRPTASLSKSESSFLAGVLENLPALPALTLPIPASYRRVGDGMGSGGTYVAWGSENRECPVRLSNAMSPASRRFEMRFIDGTANPYLALAGILGVGYDGIKSKKQLTMKDHCTAPQSPARLSVEQREALGIRERMPLKWEESRRNFVQSLIMRNIFGEEFIDKFMSVNKLLGEALSVDDNNEPKALTRLVEFY